MSQRAMTVQTVIEQITTQAAWSPWQPLEGCWLKGQGLSSDGGLYRIRLSGARELLYVGETGNLKQRLAMLKPLFDERQMPYRSPHVAGCHLWALRQSGGAAFEVSCAVLEGMDTPWRKGLEFLVIALHRQNFQRSPAANFGRMPHQRPLYWKASSSNTAQLAARGLRYRGGPTTLPDESHLPGVPPLAPLAHGNPIGEHWGGHHWSPWMSLGEAKAHVAQEQEGLYRLRQQHAPHQLLYIGYGQVAGQDQARSLKALDVECSWVYGPWFSHQQLELVCDLVADYLLSRLTLPPAQFGLSRFATQIRQGHPISPERAWWLVLREAFGQGGHAALRVAS